MNLNRISYLIAIGLALAAAAIIAFLGKSYMANAEAKFLLKPEDHQLVQSGEQIYMEQCATCHGKNLEGQPNWKTPGTDGLLPAPPHDQTGHTWHHTDITLFELTKFGLAKMADLKDHKTNMPSYEEVLEDSEIIAVLSYIKSKWPADVKKRHDEMNAQSMKE